MERFYSPKISPTRGLAASAQLWFVVAIVGQWIFVAYILGLYGRKTLHGGLPAWTETHLLNGYIPGDTFGNILLAVHVLLAALVHGLGPLQLVQHIRNRYPTFHRWNGRLFLSVSVVITLAGFYLTWARPPSFGGINGRISISIVAALILFFAGQTIRFAIRRDIPTHRRWAMRFFMLASAVWFTRLITYGGIYFAKYFGYTFSDIKVPLLLIAQYGQFLIPLTLLEMYFRAQQSVHPRIKTISAIVLFSFTLIMAYAIFVIASGSWIPRMIK